MLSQYTLGKAPPLNPRPLCRSWPVVVFRAGLPAHRIQRCQTPAEKILNMRASLKTFSHSLCRIILGTPKLTPCLRVWSFFLTREHIEETLTGPYAKSLRGLTQVRVLLTPNALRQGPYWKCKGRFLERLMNLLQAHRLHGALPCQFTSFLSKIFDVAVIVLKHLLNF